MQLPADRGKRQKRGFACARIIFIISAILHSTFYIYHLRRRADVNSVTLSSSSHAYAVSILPIGKMHDLQGGSSSSQKSRCAAIFGSPVFSAQSNGSLTFAPLSFRPRRHTPMLSAFCRLAKRSTCKATPPLPKNLASLRFSGALFNSPPSGEILRGALRQTNSFAVFGTAYRSIQDPSTDARDDKDGFCFQRSFDSRGLCPRSLRMTEERACSVGMTGRTFSDASIIYHLPFYILHLKEAGARPVLLSNFKKTQRRNPCKPDF